MELRKIAFIGAGNMSRSIINGLIEQQYPAEQLLACNPSRPKLDALEQQFAIRTSLNNADTLEWAEVIILAVKPQLMEQMLITLRQSGSLRPSQLIVSIAAGIRIKRLRDMLEGHQKLVRAMPNTPSQLGMGVTGLYTDVQIDSADQSFCTSLLNTVGKTLWLDDESQINGVIAAAGSAPAYFFLLIEAMIEHAVALGFSAEQARLMVEQTALGAAAMVSHNQEQTPAELRLQVTSKGGATAEAIASFEACGFRESVASAMDAAIARAQTMEQMF